MVRKHVPPLLALFLILSAVPSQGASDVTPGTVGHATAEQAAGGQKIQALSLPYENDCEEPNPSWVPFLNYWRLKPEQWYWDTSGGNPGGCIRHEASIGVEKPKRGAHDAAILLRGGEDWSDYVFKADAFARRGHFGLWVRADMRDEGDGNGRWVQGYYFVVIPRGPKWRLWRARQDGLVVENDAEEPIKPEKNHFSNPALLAEGPAPESVEYGKWLTLRMEVRGNRITASVNGQEVVSVENDLYPKGSVGFTTYKGEDVRFDNIRVTPLEIQAKTRVPE
jgi:hypothetical protein